MMNHLLVPHHNLVLQTKESIIDPFSPQQCIPKQSKEENIDQYGRTQHQTYINSTKYQCDPRGLCQSAVCFPGFIANSWLEWRTRKL